VSGAKRSAVLGWQCPWSGDENDPIPRRYWLWYRLYRITRQMKHRLGLHDWRPLIGQLAGGRHCSWCGEIRGLPPKVVLDES
jgi:hypothetical protein